MYVFAKTNERAEFGVELSLSLRLIRHKLKHSLLSDDAEVAKDIFIGLPSSWSELTRY